MLALDRFLRVSNASRLEQLLFSSRSLKVPGINQDSYAGSSSDLALASSPPVDNYLRPSRDAISVVRFHPRNVLLGLRWLARTQRSVRRVHASKQMLFHRGGRPQLLDICRSCVQGKQKIRQPLSVFFSEIRQDSSSPGQKQRFSFKQHLLRRMTSVRACSGRLTYVHLHEYAQAACFR